MDKNSPNQELERISGGQEPSPKFRGGPNPEDIPGFQMSRPGAHAAPAKET